MFTPHAEAYAPGLRAQYIATLRDKGLHEYARFEESAIKAESKLDKDRRDHDSGSLLYDNREVLAGLVRLPDLVKRFPQFYERPVEVLMYGSSVYLDFPILVPPKDIIVSAW